MNKVVLNNAGIKMEEGWMGRGQEMSNWQRAVLRLSNQTVWVFCWDSSGINQEFFSHL